MKHKSTITKDMWVEAEQYLDYLVNDCDGPCDREYLIYTSLHPLKMRFDSGERTDVLFYQIMSF